MSTFNSVNFRSLVTGQIPSQLHYFLELSSTNEWLSMHCEQLANFSMCIADSQSKGRGTWGRKWVSQTGENLTFSLLMNNSGHENAHFTTLCAMQSWVDVLNQFSKATVQLKWPNDLVIHSKKVGGILTEVVQRAGNQYFVVGMGININQTNFDNPETATATSLKLESAGNCFQREELLALWCASFENNRMSWSSNPSKVLKQLGTYFIHFNTATKIANSEKRVEFKGLSERGFPLVLEANVELEVTDPMVRFEYA